MALLPDDPRNQVKLLAVILAVAAGALYYQFVHAPGRLELVELSERVEVLETQNELAEARIGNLQRLRDELADTERQLGILERLVPGTSEVPEIYEAIATEAQTRNLQLLSIEPLAPSPADSAGSLMRQEWALVVEGGYHAVGEFLTRVASFDRIVRPRVTEIGPAGTTASGRQLVRAMFSLETFVLGLPAGEDGAETDAGSGGRDADETGGGSLVGGGG